VADATHRLALVLEAKNEASRALQEAQRSLRELENAASGMPGGMKRAEAGISSLGRGLRDLRDTASQIIPGFNLILGGIGLGGGVMAGRWLWQTTMDLAETGAAADRMAEAFERRIGEDAVRALERMRQASQGTISDTELMAAATRAQMLGVGDDAETLAGLVEVAARRGRDLGMGTAAAFSDIVTGIGRLSPMILDNLGIVMDAETTYANYADDIGKAGEELSDLEKRQALVNRVLEEATGKMGELDAAGQLEAQAAATANFRQELGLLISELWAGTGVTEAYTDAITGLTDAMRLARRERERAAQPAEAFQRAIDDAVKSGQIGANVAMDYRRKLGMLATSLQDGTLNSAEYAMAVDHLHSEMNRVYGLTDDWDVALRNQNRTLDETADAANEAARAVAKLSDEELRAAVRRGQAVGYGLVGGMEPGLEGRLRSQAAADALALQMAADAEAEREAERHASTMQRLYEEQQATFRAMAESILTPTEVTPADMFRAQTGALGGYVEKWDESARRLQDIANRGAASPWWEVLEIPEEVLAQGEEAVRIWARETADAVQRGVRPDMIDWEAFDRAAEEFQRDQEAQERTIAMAMERLGGAVPETEVRQMLGVPADAQTEALAVGEAFQQGLGAVDMARAVTDQMHEQMQAQMQRWVTMGSMTVTWFARGLEEGVADDTGLRIAKKLWPMIAPMIDSYLAKGVWN
jgi:hypothetical protein